MSKSKKRRWCKPAYETKSGRMYRGKCEEVLLQYPVTRRRGTVQLIFTSPPFALNRKKKYGNLQGDEYIDWLSSLASLFRDQIKSRGSIVIELGNAWVPGTPTMSTLAIKALLAFKEAADLHLCQEFICFNPAKLPTPAEWVGVRRIRVKDASRAASFCSRGRASANCSSHGDHRATYGCANDAHLFGRKKVTQPRERKTQSPFPGDPRRRPIC